MWLQLKHISLTPLVLRMTQQTSFRYKIHAQTLNSTVPYFIVTKDM